MNSFEYQSVDLRQLIEFVYGVCCMRYITFNVFNVLCREAIFDWDPHKDPTEQTNPTLDSEDYMPVSVVGHLQVLFALMRHSSSRYIDPSKFVEALGLDTSTQQDAQVTKKN